MKVGWAEDKGNGSTKFSKHFCSTLEGANIGNIDEQINAKLEEDISTMNDTEGHFQMIEITKRGLTKSFVFF